jgi:hypothetical protein
VPGQALSKGGARSWRCLKDACALSRARGGPWARCEEARAGRASVIGVSGGIRTREALGIGSHAPPPAFCVRHHSTRLSASSGTLTLSDCRVRVRRRCGVRAKGYSHTLRIRADNHAVGASRSLAGFFERGFPLLASTGICRLQIRRASARCLGAPNALALLGHHPQEEIPARGCGERTMRPQSLHSPDQGLFCWPSDSCNSAWASRTGAARNGIVGFSSRSA